MAAVEPPHPIITLSNGTLDARVASVYAGPVCVGLSLDQVRPSVLTYMIGVPEEAPVIAQRLPVHVTPFPEFDIVTDVHTSPSVE
jgi:hypothetical protein